MLHRSISPTSTSGAQSSALSWTVPTSSASSTIPISSSFLCLGGSNNSVDASSCIGGGCEGLFRTSHQSQQQQQQQQQQPNHPPPSRRRQEESNSGFIPLDEEEDVDKVLARDLYTMTVQERERALHDVHGIADSMVETHELVQSAKSKLRHQLSLIGYRSTAYQLAMSQCSECVESLHIIFLRRDGYDVNSAASRMLSHFDMKMTLWGETTLGRNITLNDFNEDDMACLNEGLFHSINCRDQAGRALFCKLWSHQKYNVRENVWRTLWYHKMSAAHDEETQIKGMTAVIYNVCDNWMDTFDHVLFQGVAKVREAIPIRDAAIHYCYSDPKFGAAVAFISRVFEADSRTRSRLHKGTHLEVQYDLLSYGIPNSALPLSADGVSRKKENMNFIRMRRAQEERIRSGDTTFQVIVVPSRKDVLFGRGKPVQTHPGNLRLSYLVEEQIGLYLKGNRQEKGAITNNVYQTMKMDSTRFLRQDNDSVFFEVDEKTAIDKISHFFRNRKQKLPKKSSSSPVGTTTTQTGALLSSSNKNKRATTSSSTIQEAATTLPVPPHQEDDPAPVSEDEDNVDPELWNPFQDLMMSLTGKRSRTVD